MPGTLYCMEPGGAGKTVSQMRRGVLEFCAMVLSHDGSRYGVGLLHELDTVDAMATSEGRIYPLLPRLHRGLMAGAQWRESPTGPPRPLIPAHPGRPADIGRIHLADERRSAKEVRRFVFLSGGGQV
ncbi:PadR family transcriptional regulator [Catenulispora rubra]|uniref:PadR family transcriptional regulator n=1 Tax=Catenulispora rubra TaxID=280293 RepID=UPI0034DD19B4